MKTKKGPRKKRRLSEEYQFEDWQILSGRHCQWCQCIFVNDFTKSASALSACETLLLILIVLLLVLLL